MRELPTFKLQAIVEGKKAERRWHVAHNARPATHANFNGVTVPLDNRAVAGASAVMRANDASGNRQLRLHALNAIVIGPIVGGFDDRRNESLKVFL